MRIIPILVNNINDIVWYVFEHFQDGQFFVVNSLDDAIEKHEQIRYPILVWKIKDERVVTILINELLRQVLVSRSEWKCKGVREVLKYSSSIVHDIRGKYKLAPIFFLLGERDELIKNAKNACTFKCFLKALEI